VSDAAVRERLTRDLGETIFVQAGAGTGKTSALVSRIVALVARDGLQMESLAAITFTEAAAAELRDRVRSGLEAAMDDPSLSAEEREACRRSAAGIDLASIQTIHSFCGTLLRTFPLEAGLPPGFATWDEIESRQDFEERFRAWLYDEVPSASQQDRRAAIRRALLLGMTPDRLRELASGLQDQYDLINHETNWESPEQQDALQGALDCCRLHGATLQGLVSLIPQAINGEADVLVQEIRATQFVADRMAASAEQDEALAALQELLARPPKRNIGRKNDWRPSAGTNPVDDIREAFREAREAAEVTLEASRIATLSDVLGYLRDFTLSYADRRRRLGVATFHDLLTGRATCCATNLGYAARRTRAIGVCSWMSSRTLTRCKRRS
jgi:ATP-dependent helicase/nuclease subunit A